MTDKLYKGNYNFWKDTDGENPAGLTIDEAGGTVEVISNFDGHKKVLELHDMSGNAKVTLSKSFTSKEYGSIELYMGMSDVAGEKGMVIFYSEATRVIYLRLTGSKFEYYDGSWHDLLTGLSNDTMYHIRIDFERTAGGYCGLAQNKWRCTINENEYDNLSLENNTDIDLFDIHSNTSNTNYYIYIDSIGFSWEDDYDVGDNKELYTEFEVSDVDELTKALFCIDSNEGIILLPDSTITLTETILIDNEPNLTIKGNGDISILDAENVATAIEISDMDSGYIRFEDFKLKNMGNLTRLLYNHDSIGRVLFKNLTLEHQHLDLDDIFDISQCQNTIIDNCRIKNLTTEVNYAVGIKLNNSSKCVIMNTTSDNHYQNINFSLVNYCEMYKCTIKNALNYGIVLSQSNNNWIYDITYENNYNNNNIIISSGSGNVIY